MKTTLLTASAFAMVATASIAQSPLSASAALQAVEAKGYTVTEIDREAAWFEIDALMQNGMRVELIVDADTAKILSEAADD